MNPPANTHGSSTRGNPSTLTETGTFLRDGVVLSYNLAQFGKPLRKPMNVGEEVRAPPWRAHETFPSHSPTLSPLQVRDFFQDIGPICQLDLGPSAPPTCHEGASDQSHREEEEQEEEEQAEDMKRFHHWI